MWYDPGSLTVNLTDLHRGIELLLFYSILALYLRISFKICICLLTGYLHFYLEFAFLHSYYCLCLRLIAICIVFSSLPYVTEKTNVNLTWFVSGIMLFKKQTCVFQSCIVCITIKLFEKALINIMILLIRHNFQIESILTTFMFRLLPF